MSNKANFVVLEGFLSELLFEEIKIQKILDYLGELGFDPQFGARPLKRVLQRNVLNELSKEILAGNISKDNVVGMTLDNEGKIQFLNLDKVEL